MDAEAEAHKLRWRVVLGPHSWLRVNFNTSARELTKVQRFPLFLR
jgi:hypothetical protein